MQPAYPAALAVSCLGDDEGLIILKKQEWERQMLQDHPQSLGTGSEYSDCALISFCGILQLVESGLLYHRELGGAFVWLCLLVSLGLYSVKPPGYFM